MPNLKTAMVMPTILWRCFAMDMPLVIKASYDESLRKGIIDHVQRHQSFFEGDLKKMDGFLRELEWCQRQAILLREDTGVFLRDDVDAYKKAIFSLDTDYDCLRLISDHKTPSEVVNGYLMDIIKNYDQEECQSQMNESGQPRISKYQLQIDITRVLVDELQTYIRGQAGKLEKPQLPSAGALMGMLTIQERLYKFLRDYQLLMAHIEEERRSFDLMLHRVCESSRVISLNKLTDDLEGLIADYRSKVNSIIALDLQKMKEEEVQEKNSPGKSPGKNSPKESEGDLKKRRSSKSPKSRTTGTLSLFKKSGP